MTVVLRRQLLLSVSDPDASRSRSGLPAPCRSRCDQSAQESGIGHYFAAGGDGICNCRENTGDDGFLRRCSFDHDGQDIIGDAVQPETILERFRQALHGGILRRWRRR